MQQKCSSGRRRWPPDEMAERLAHVASRPAPGRVYPMVLAACHTGARRGELLRAKQEDLDRTAGVLTRGEKKRVRGTRTTRRVPLSGPRRAELTRWQADRGSRPYLFGLDEGPLAVQTAQKVFGRVLKGSKWSVLTGWHVQRHSFVSALASRGIDQRLIDEFVGHQSEAMRRRYRHLYPSTQAEAIRLVFGGLPAGEQTSTQVLPAPTQDELLKARRLFRPVAEG